MKQKKIPLVTIVGKQNVGKSTLFNLLSKKKIAITKDFPGVTRDILQEIVQIPARNMSFVLCDSPGLDVNTTSDLNQKVLEIALNQIRKSDIIIFLLDKKEITEYDFQLIKIFREDETLNQKPIIHCVNKIDSSKDELDLDEFYKMGLKEILPISCIGRKNIKLLLKKVEFFLESKVKVSSPEIKYSISIVGKPNSGKSTLINTLANFERTVVSDEPGTTRDSINLILEHKNELLEVIDTAGVKKKSHKSEAIEFYSYKRTIQSIEKSNVVIYLISVDQGISSFDKKLIDFVHEKGKPVLIAISKWDLLEGKHSNSFSEYKADLCSKLPKLKNIPMISFSSLEKQRHLKTLDLTTQIFENSQVKISTSELNRVFRKWLEEKKVTESSSEKLQTFYTTQISSCPFKVLLFLHNPKKFKANLVNFLKNRLYKNYKLNAIPIEIEVRGNREKRR